MTERGGKTDSTAAGTWITEYDSDDTAVEHLDGVPRSKAPLPWRLHRCRAQTRGRTGFILVRRCACGAIDLGLGWGEKNQRRKDKGWDR